MAHSQSSSSLGILVSPEHNLYRNKNLHLFIYLDNLYSFISESVHNQNGKRVARKHFCSEIAITIPETLWVGKEVCTTQCTMFSFLGGTKVRDLDLGLFLSFDRSPNLSCQLFACLINYLQVEPVITCVTLHPLYSFFRAFLFTSRRSTQCAQLACVVICHCVKEG